MFGLMRAKKCGMSADERHFRRLNYCGTCKTIGSAYSAKARLLLNHDTVFLAEILTALRGESVDEWQRSYQSFNCLSLPKESIPASLGWAAAANVILTEFKVADHIDDREGVRFRALRRAFSSDFQTASRLLAEWNFPLDEIREILGSQPAREAAVVSLDDLAFPTAETTARFFRDGVRHIGRDELADTALKLGFAFGKMIYLIDAFEDYEKDVRRGHFNAFRAVYDLSEASIPAGAKRKIVELILELEREIAANIGELPIDALYKTRFGSRLAQNVRRICGAHLPVLNSNTACSSRPRLTFREHLSIARDKARTLAGNYSWQMPLVFVFVFVFALAAPAAQAREARSARECFDMSFNLMFLGAVLGSVLTLPKSLLMNSILGPDEAAGHAAKKASSGWCGSCGCGDACDCCDGCSDCGDCCDCCTSCDC